MRHLNSRTSYGSYWRRWAAGCGVLLAALLALRIWVLQGCFLPLRVTESSMVPNLVGEHAVVTCPVCRRSFAVSDFSPSDQDLRAVCPRCGSLHELTGPVAWVRGDRVLMGKWLPDRSDRLRWRAVALKNPGDAHDWLVKRVVGLPGETLELRGGDVYIDGAILAKSLEQFRQMAIPLYDTADLSASVARAVWSRWQPTSGDATWRLEDQAYVAGPTAADRWSWLAFQGCDLPGRRPRGMLMLDDYAFNQSLSRRLYPVHDLLLRAELRHLRRGRVACRLTIDGQTAEVRWDPQARHVECRFVDQVVVERWLPTAFTAPRVCLELAICDRRLHFALDRRTVLTMPLPPGFAPMGGGIERLELGAGGGGLTLAGVELFRDVYYLRPPAAGDRPGEVVLAPNEFYVLGDNSPVSQDSRSFGPVRRSELLGVVWPWRSAGR